MTRRAVLIVIDDQDGHLADCLDELHNTGRDDICPTCADTVAATIRHGYVLDTITTSLGRTDITEIVAVHPATGEAAATPSIDQAIAAILDHQPDRQPKETTP